MVTKRAHHNQCKLTRVGGVGVAKIRGQGIGTGSELGLDGHGSMMGFGGVIIRKWGGGLLTATVVLRDSGTYTTVYSCKFCRSLTNRPQTLLISLQEWNDMAETRIESVALSSPAFSGNVAQYMHRRSAFGIDTDGKRFALSSFNRCSLRRHRGRGGIASNGHPAWLA